MTNKHSKKLIEDFKSKHMKKKPVGRPRESFKYGGLDVFSWKKLQSKIKVLRDYEKSLIENIIKDIEFLKKIQEIQ